VSRNEGIAMELVQTETGCSDRIGINQNKILRME
jgi:hypothetical protein